MPSGDPPLGTAKAYTSPALWAAERLKNGNTLITGNAGAFVREVNRGGEVVWEIKQSDLPDIQFRITQRATRLANGNTVFCHWIGSLVRKNWSKVVQVIEVTPDKKAVWALNQWSNPDPGPATSIQVLDGGEHSEELDWPP